MNSPANVLVCVTQQKTCERLIIKSREFYPAPENNLFVLHVVKDGSPFLDNPKEGEALQYLFSVSRDSGANLTVLRSDNVENCISQYAITNKITCIILGSSGENNGSPSFGDRLKALLPGIEFKIIP